MAAGVVLTVAVAWGCLLWIDEPVARPTLRSLETAEVAPWASILTRYGHSTAVEARVEWTGVLLRWVENHEEPDQVSILDFSAGMPFFAMRMMHWASMREEHAGGVPLPDLLSRSDRWAEFTKNRGPVRPLWPGFALNTAFYAGIVFLLWSAPGLIRRRSRTRRGLCTACGYDLRGAAGNVCPECGGRTLSG